MYSLLARPLILLLALVRSFFSIPHSPNFHLELASSPSHSPSLALLMMVHLPSSLILLLSLSAVFALPAPAHRRRDINISHTSRSNGTAITHTIDPSTLDPALKAAIEGSDLNINM